MRAICEIRVEVGFLVCVSDLFMADVENDEVCRASIRALRVGVYDNI